MRNLHDIHGAVEQIIAGPVDFESIEIFDWRITGFTDENSIKIGLRIADIGGEVLNGQPLGDVLVHVVDNRVDLCVQIVMGQMPGAEGFQKEECPQKMFQAQVGIADVFLREFGIEHCINFLEKIQPLLDTRLLRGLNHHWLCAHAVCKLPGFGSHEVNPIDGPWRIVVGSITVGSIGRNDKHLVGDYFMARISHADPSAARLAVNQDTLSTAFWPGYEMVPSVREVSDGLNEQVTAERIAAHRDNVPIGNDDETFTLESVLDFHDLENLG